MKFVALTEYLRRLCGLIVPPAHRHPLDAYAWIAFESFSFA